jgi:hypothetical protein
VAIVAFFMLSYALWPPSAAEAEAPPEGPSPPSQVPVPVGNPGPRPDAGFCAYCGTRLGEGYRYCPNCARAIHQTKRCSACGTEICAECGREFSHCPACGVAL